MFDHIEGDQRVKELLGLHDRAEKIIDKYYPGIGVSEKPAVSYGFGSSPDSSGYGYDNYAKDASNVRTIM